MNVLSPKRAILFVVASLLSTAALASRPSPRLYPVMAYDEHASAGVLFGGRAPTDPATGLTHASDETWLWKSSQWVQAFPGNHPPARSSQAMAYDSLRNRVVLFGGRKEATVVREDYQFHNDTWVWQNGDWQQLATPNAPPGREFTSMSYDRDRDRIVLFGGYHYQEDGETIQAQFDTWEFDGQTWTEVSATGPSVAKPLLAYDAARKETILLGIDNVLATLMYRWDPDAKTWVAESPAAKPPCVNEAALTYQAHNQKLVLVGGVCGSSTFVDETWEWDGDNWTKLTTTATTRYAGSALTYDTAEHQVVRFGGTAAFSGTPDSSTYVYRELVWTFRSPIANPTARSLSVFRRDPVRNNILLMGGLSEFAFTGSTSIFYNDDFWRFQDGQWYQESPVGMPSQCEAPLSAFDVDRGKLIVYCGGSGVFEWDGLAWKSFEDLDDAPDPRRFGGLVYDQTLKKTVLFGGYDGANYRDDTWTWNGTVWDEIDTRDEPENRGQVHMWYDSLLKKTVLFSGVGRPNIDERVTRFSDMWTFDGSNWTKLTVTETPGIRFGAQVAVDPRNGKVMLFGGLRATVQEKIVDQFYDDDLWMWDGSTSRWTQIETPRAPSPRQNGGFDFDPTLNKFVLFGGFAGNLYFSDVWTLDGSTWVPVPDRVTVNRRRSTRP